MEQYDEIIIDLLEAIESAISSGDWKVDGACDPDLTIQRAKQYLRDVGFVQNSIDDSWMV